MNIADLARVKKMEEALRQARDAINSLPDYALGGVVQESTDGSGMQFQYPIKDELLAFIDEALHSAEGG